MMTVLWKNADRRIESIQPSPNNLGISLGKRIMAIPPVRDSFFFCHMGLTCMISLLSLQDSYFDEVTTDGKFNRA